MKKLNVFFAVVAAVSMLIAGFALHGWLFHNQPAAVTAPAGADAAPHVALTVETLYELIEPCTDLITATDRYTNRATLSDHRELFGCTLPFTTEEVEFSYIGTLSAGIDLSQVQFDINEPGRTIYVTVPAPTVISHAVDISSFIFQTKHDGLFTEISPDEFISKLDLLALKQEAATTKSGEVFRIASENAEQTLTRLLTAASVTNGYTLRFFVDY
ncbi:MAG TPA: hypothetical protein DCG49_05705 [Ruminococcus sp.]|nr:hypothetical protein [Ruminococcus sp.]